MLAEFHVEDFSDCQPTHGNADLRTETFSVDNELLAFLDADTVFLEESFL